MFVTFFYSDFYSRAYNSTYCTYVLRCNVHVFANEITEAKFYHFFKNQQDILLGANSDCTKLTLSHANFTMNGKSNGEYGCIHSNNYKNDVLTVESIFAFGNQSRVFNPESGRIIVKSFVGDSFAYTGNRQISAESINVKQEFVMTTKFARILVCEKKTKKKFTCRIRRSKSRLSILFYSCSCLLESTKKKSEILKKNYKEQFLDLVDLKRKKTMKKDV